MGDFWDEELLRQNKEAIMECGAKVWESFKEAYAHLRTAKAVHDEWEEFYLEGLDYTKTNIIANTIIGEIFSRQPIVRHMFASAISPEGVVNYINNITENISTRYILKGMPGTGKSTLVGKVVQAAVERGYHVDIYHCSLDPDCIDMVVIPEISVAVLDGSKPNNIEPVHKGDRVIDLLECVDPIVLEKNAEGACEAEKRFEAEMEKAISCIAQAKKTHDDLETYYIDAMDFEAIDQMRETIMNKILNLSSKGDTSKKSKFILQTG